MQQCGTERAVCGTFCRLLAAVCLDAQSCCVIEWQNRAYLEVYSVALCSTCVLRLDWCA